MKKLKPLFATWALGSVLVILSSYFIRFCAAAHSGNSNPDILKQTEILDSSDDHGMVVTWEYNVPRKTITFDLKTKTKGFIGFGLSIGGGMTDADIVIGGVYPDGTPYFHDYHGIGNMAPELDEKQDWKLLKASEDDSHTYLKFTRLLDTCDPQDVAITNDTVNIIWAHGPKDGLHYHLEQRGTLAANLLDPPYPDVDVNEFKTWDLTVDMPMPNRSFAYWCTIHKAPKFDGKNHVVGFRPALFGPKAVQHTHHFVLYKCSAPPGAEGHEYEIFDPFADKPGDDCYMPEAMKRRPTQLCATTLYVWGAGGKTLLLPEHVGYPVGNEKNEYFMLEIHYDNPNQLSGVQFKTGVEVYYTNKLRQYDAAMMTIGHVTMASLLIPPESKNFMITGHCSDDCTSKYFPEDGITIFNVLLHTHLAGRKMRLRHFRNDTELPWIANDDHYHFNYQKNRPLAEERKVIRGDHLTFECTYDTMDRKIVTSGGYSTTDEMCETFVWYYPAFPMKSCASAVVVENLFRKLGIQRVNWAEGIEEISNPVIAAPPSMANKTYREALNTMINWTPTRKADIQRMLRYSDQLSLCSRDDTPPPPPPPASADRSNHPAEPNTSPSTKSTTVLPVEPMVEKHPLPAQGITRHQIPEPAEPPLTNVPLVPHPYKPPSLCMRSIDDDIDNEISPLPLFLASDAQRASAGLLACIHVLVTTIMLAIML